MKKVILLPILALFVATSLLAQFDMPRYKDLMKLKNRQLIVETLEEDETVMDKLEKVGDPDYIKQYKNYIDNYNSTMKAAVEKYWNFNGKNVLYKSPKEVNELFADKSQKANYIVMYCHTYKENYIGIVFEKIHAGQINIGGSKDYAFKAFDAYFAVGAPNDPTVDMRLGGVIPSSNSIFYAIATTNFEFNYVYNHHGNCDMKDMIHDYTSRLQNKTLLLLQGDVSKNVINNISDYYPGKYQVVNYRELLSKINSTDSSYAFAIMTWETSVTHTHVSWIVDCADGAILAYGKYGLRLLSEDNDILDKEFFKDMAGFYNERKKK